MESILKRGRGRPKKIDRIQVLDFVMISYWNDGPTNVSINDICKKLGISKPSLYNEFGSEDELQAAALHNYHEKILSQLFKIFDETIPFNHSLKKLIDLSTIDRSKEGLPYGCLHEQMCNAGNRLGLLTRLKVEDLSKKIANGYQCWIEKAKSNGSVSNEYETIFLSKYIQTQITSALQLQKEGFDKEFVLQYLKAAFYFFN